MKPLISVIVPVYKVELYLAECVYGAGFSCSSNS